MSNSNAAQRVAFHASAAVKSLCIGRIEAGRDSGSLHPQLQTAWMPEYGICTPIGAIIESVNLEQFEVATGLPLSLGLLHQYLVATCVVAQPRPEPEDGAASPPLFVLPQAIGSYWTAWLEAIEPGIQVPDLFASTVAGVLTDLLSPDHILAPLPVPLRSQIASVQAVFEDEAAGHNVSGTQWTQVRNQCSAMTDTLVANSAANDSNCSIAIAQLLESLCWSWDGNYIEPLSAIQGFAGAVTAWRVAQIEAPSHRSIKERATIAMAEIRDKAVADPSIDFRAMVTSDPAVQVANSPEFAIEAAQLYSRVTPEVGGRMMKVFLDRIKTLQTH